MSDIIDVPHPVPVRYVPKGGRHQRLAYDARVSPIRITRASTLDFPPTPIITGGKWDLRAHEGRLWLPLRRSPADMVDLDGLRRFMSEDIPQGFYCYTDLFLAFAGTPVVATVHGGHTRGAPFDRSKVREFLDDGASAPAAVQAFFDQNVRVCSGQVYVRCLGPLVSVSFTRGGMELNPFPRWKDEECLVCGLDGIDDLWRHLRAKSPMFAQSMPDKPRQDRIDFKDAPAHLFGDDELTVLTNRLARFAQPVLTHLSERRSLSEKARDDVRQALAILTPHALDAGMGLVSAGHFEAMARMSGLAAGATAFFAPDKDDHAMWEAFRHFAALGEYIRETVLPRLLDRGLAAEDGAALAGLGGP